MTLVYRLVRQKYADRPVDVTGTWLNGGRWNPPGVGILYTAEHPALALVEILVHMPQVPYSELPDLQHNTGQIFKQHVEVAHYNSQKGKDTPTMNASVAGCTRSRYSQTSPV